MGEENTPPASPQAILDNDEINEDDIEVIDLDEGLEDDDIEDDDLEMIEEGSEIVQDVKDNSIKVFSEHTKSVFCVDIFNDFAASGGEDDLCYIWNLKSGEILLKIQDFKDSVTHVKFNHDGSFLAVADMSGLIKVMKISTTLQSEPVWTFETGDISVLQWHPGANVLFAGTEDSSFWMWKIPGGQSKIFQGNGEKVETAVILPDGKKAAVGYADGSLRIFELKSEEILHNISVFTDPLCSIDARNDNQLLALGNVEGEIAILNNSSGKILSRFTKKKVSIESMIFSSPELNQLLVADVDGNFTVWDLSSQIDKICTKLGSGIVKISWFKDKILAATFDGLIRLVDPRNGNVDFDFSGHLDNVLDFAISRDLKILVSASDDSTCRVYELDHN